MRRQNEDQQNATDSYIHLHYTERGGERGGHAHVLNIIHKITKQVSKSLVYIPSIFIFSPKRGFFLFKTACCYQGWLLTS